MKELVRVRLLTSVCRLCGLVWPLVVGSASQAHGGVPPSCVNDGNDCDLKHEAASGAMSHQSFWVVGYNALTPYFFVWWWFA